MLFFFVFISRYIIRTRYTHQQLLFPFNAVRNAKSFAVSVSSSSFLSHSLFLVHNIKRPCGNGRNNTIWYYLFSLLTLPFLYNRVYVVRMVHQFISQTKILNVVLYATSIMNYKVYFIQGYRWYTNWNKIYVFILHWYIQLHIFIIRTW